MFESSRIELSKTALENNLSFLMGNILRKGTVYSSVVKGNAYGHGIEKFVPLAETCGVEHFSTFSTDEAYLVKQCIQNHQATIMIMGNVDDHELEWAVQNKVEFFVFDLVRLERAIEMAKKVGIKARVHLEFETGMNRTGFEYREIRRLPEILKRQQEHLSIEGFCTHFAGAEDVSNQERVFDQVAYFDRYASNMKAEKVSAIKNHIACSAATIRYPETQRDMVRVGILQYGFWPSPEIEIACTSVHGTKLNPLKRILSWKSQVMDVKNVKAGEYIGYGTSYMANDNMRVATVPVGYSHGFSRGLSNQGRVLIRGKRVGVVGTVNMNAITVDVSRIDNVEKGDEVVLIGKQGDLEITVASFSEFSDQVNYELLTRLPLNIPRYIVP